MSEPSSVQATPDELPPRRGKRGPRSDKPERILEFLRKYFAEYSYPPSVRDIVEGCKLSSTSVADYNLKILEREGHIRRDRERARTISLTQPVEPTEPTRIESSPLSVGIPLLGTIAAGTRSLVPEGVDVAHAESRISVTPDMLAGRDPERVFALTVRGDSMIDALIADSDTVILEEATSVDNGQMAAVWLRDDSDNYCTLKRVYYEQGQVRLQPENPTMDPIYTDESNMQIQGRVVSVIRHPR
ncbi:MAG: transcriptional repressor LexA [Chloroflexi bacterium]|nr:transcriptional repressor LexA [Chloroflexota bacterium]MCY3695632.1 transcriptional repressor LexA [Chloroflexota bacterium]